MSNHEARLDTQDDQTADSTVNNPHRVICLDKRHQVFNADDMSIRVSPDFLKMKTFLKCTWLPRSVPASESPRLR